MHDGCPTSDTFLSIPYLQAYFCATPTARPFVFLGLLLWLSFLFSTLGISAADFFCPNLATIAQLLNLDENVAGVTFLAFGNGSPGAYAGSPFTTTSDPCREMYSAMDREPNIFAGTGSNALNNIRVINNYTYHSPGTWVQFANVNMGWNEDTGPNQNLTVQGNYIVGGLTAFRMKGWSTATVTGNTMYGEFVSGYDNWGPVDLGYGQATSHTYSWNNNAYYYTGSATPFDLEGSPPQKDFPGWKAATGFDSTSSYAAGRPTGIRVFIRPNLYQAGRANIAVYNWDRANSVNVDLSQTGLSNGQSYEIRNGLNYFGTPVLTGTYNASSPVVSVSMTSAAATAVATPIGHSYTPPTTLPDFGVFVVVPR